MSQTYFMDRGWSVCLENFFKFSLTHYVVVVNCLVWTSSLIFAFSVGTIVDILPYCALCGLFFTLLFIEVADLECEDWASFSLAGPKHYVLAAAYVAYAVLHLVYDKSSYDVMVGVILFPLLASACFSMVLNQQNSRWVSDTSNMMMQDLSKAAKFIDLKSVNNAEYQNVLTVDERMKLLLDNYDLATTEAKKGQDRLIVVSFWMALLVFFLMLKLVISRHDGHKAEIYELTNVVIFLYGFIAAEFQLLRVCNWNVMIGKVLNIIQRHDTNIVATLGSFVPTKELLFGYYMSVVIFLCKMIFFT